MTELWRAGAIAVLRDRIPTLKPRSLAYHSAIAVLQHHVTESLREEIARRHAREDEDHGRRAAIRDREPSREPQSA